ncbi:MAG: dihydrodipicolinate synthase family protein [Bacteroidetes bacterium]|nr:dihydrodipicolinate synthase family protein [Bacteroidota bacterium]MBS1609093.1 dihydrodipicolinate synthase family protein [Bacteroidota bacterium]
MRKAYHTRRDFLQLLSASVITASGFPKKLLSFPVAGEKKFVPVMVTPFTASSQIDFDALSKLIDFYFAAGAKGFFANCLSSEMYALNADERIALARHVVKRVNGKVSVVASGSFGNTTKEQAEFTKKMYDTGVNAVILISSHFADKDDSDDILIRNFEKFFSATGNIPVGTYECPSPYKRILTPVVFKYLLSTNRLIYHKDTTLSVEKVKEKIELAKNTKLEIYDAHTPNAMYSLQAGAKGISAIAGNFYPEIYAWLCENVNKTEKQDDVKWIQSEITRLDPVISDGYSMSAKYFLHKRGVPIAPICRTNKNSLTSSQVQKLDELYRLVKTWHERLGIKIPV